MDIAKEKRAIQYLKTFEPQTEPYYLCYSGGKDSDVIRILAGLAGVKHDIVNNHTTVDAPETVRYIRSIPNIIINYPEKTMWQLIVHKGIPPTRLVRYCCAELKEKGGKGRMKITGVRKAESVNRLHNSDLIKIIGKPKSVERLADEMQVEIKKPTKAALFSTTIMPSRGNLLSIATEPPRRCLTPSLIGAIKTCGISWGITAVKAIPCTLAVSAVSDVLDALWGALNT